jgi:hypothetical protein
MDAKVHQGIGAARRPRREEPDVFVRGENILRKVAPAKASQRSEVALRDAMSEQTDERIASIGVGDRADATGVISRFHHPKAILRGVCHRLLAEDVRSGFETRHCLLGVKMIGRTYVDDIQPTLREHPPKVVISRTAAESGGGGERASADSDKLAAQLADHASVDARDAASSDDRCTHLCLRSTVLFRDEVPNLLQRVGLAAGRHHHFDGGAGLRDFNRLLGAVQPKAVTDEFIKGHRFQIGRH